MMNNLIKCLLVLTPICYSPQIPLKKFDLLIFYLSIMSLFSLSMGLKPFRTVGASPFIGVAVLSSAGMVFHNFHPIVVSSAINVFVALIGIKVLKAIILKLIVLAKVSEFTANVL